MAASEPLIRNVSDTALWVALYRARESERPDALFRDPYARALAGERGAAIARTVTFADKHAWSFTARTYLFDRMIEAELARGTDLVLSLAAGLDARPYRMRLAPALRWIEVDLPGILDYKESALGSALPACHLERIRLDLAGGTARRALFERLGAEARRITMLSEGLLIYFSAEQVASLARDLAAVGAMHSWIVDLASPGLVQMMIKNMGGEVIAAGAPFKFGPAEGPSWFVEHGWRPVEVQHLLKAASRIHRLPWKMKPLAWLPGTHPGNRPQPWSAVIRLER